jgi:hypothetical protein
MSEEEEAAHQPLFSGASLELGKAQWYILKADTEIEKRMYIENKKEGSFSEKETTPFGEEVGLDEIHWWVFRRESDLEELNMRTINTLTFMQKLKEDSLLTKNKASHTSYADLIGEIKKFTEQHSKEIHAFYEYVDWLHSKDLLAPSILFSYRVWGSTRLSDRMMSVKAESIDVDQKGVEKCVEIAVGLRQRMELTIDFVHGDLAADIYDDAYETGAPWPLGDPVSKDDLITSASNRIMTEFAAYFEFIRNSFRSIIMEIDRYKEQIRLLHNETFLELFTKKAMSTERIETQLWDFKKTFEMWECKPEIKIEKEIDFVEHVASYANSNGGVLIVGITDDLPRRVIGLTNLENKVKAAKTMIDRFTDNGTPTIFQQVTLKNDADKDCNCLLIFVAQTAHVIHVKDQQGKLSYPIRQGTGRERSTPEVIQAAKAQLPYDNYNFASALDSFTRGK